MISNANLERLNEGECPDCGGRGFQLGPRGGLALNVRCAGCGATFWYCPPFPPSRIPPLPDLYAPEVGPLPGPPVPEAVARAEAEDAAIVERMAHELQGAPGMDVVMKPETAFQFVGLLQLAMRHPTLPPRLADTATKFIAAARANFANCPTVLDVIDRGDDPAQDRAPRRPAES